MRLITGQGSRTFRPQPHMRGRRKARCGGGGPAAGRRPLRTRKRGSAAGSFRCSRRIGTFDPGTSIHGAVRGKPSVAGEGMLVGVAGVAAWLVPGVFGMLTFNGGGHGQLATRRVAQEPVSRSRAGGATVGIRSTPRSTTIESFGCSSTSGEHPSVRMRPWVKPSRSGTRRVRSSSSITPR